MLIFKLTTVNLYSIKEHQNVLKTTLKRSNNMKDKDFNRLVEGAKQFAQIKRGELKPSRVFKFTAIE